MRLNRRSAIGLGLAAAMPAIRRARAAEVLKIGTTADMSGSGAQWGLALSGAVRVAAEEANAEGGLKVGESTYKVQVISYDDQYQAQKTVNTVSRLVDQDGVKFIIGPAASAGALAIKPLVEQRKVITFAAVYSQKMLEPPCEFVYRMSNTPNEFVPPMARWIAARMKDGPKDVVGINPNDDTGWSEQQVQAKAYPAAGFKVVGQELYERSVTDFQPILTRIFALHPTVIDLGPTTPATAGLVVRQARDMGYQGMFVKLGAPGVQEIIAAAGVKAVEGFISYLPSDVDNPGYQRVAAQFTKLMGNPPNSTFLQYYDTAKLLMAAVQKAGTIDDTRAVNAAIPQVMPWRSAMGVDLRLQGKAEYGIDHQIFTPFFASVIENGKSVVSAVSA